MSSTIGLRKQVFDEYLHPLLVGAPARARVPDTFPVRIRIRAPYNKRGINTASKPSGDGCVDCLAGEAVSQSE